MYVEQNRFYAYTLTYIHTFSFPLGGIHKLDMYVDKIFDPLPLRWHLVLQHFVNIWLCNPLSPLLVNVVYGCPLAQPVDDYTVCLIIVIVITVGHIHLGRGMLPPGFPIFYASIVLPLENPMAFSKKFRISWAFQFKFLKILLSVWVSKMNLDYIFRRYLE